MGFPRLYKAFFILFIFSFFYSPVFAQKKTRINIVNAETLEYDVNLGANVQRLKGDVQFENKGLLLFCDSAYFYPNNFIEAFGKVHANRGDSIHLFSDELEFDGDKQVAVAIGNVSLSDKEMLLESNQLYFDIKENTSAYYNGGIIHNKENTLTSKRGFYNSNTNVFSFKDSVQLKNPEYK